MFEILALRAFSDNYIWTLIKDDEFTVVDPGDDQVVTEFLNKQNLSLSNILITPSLRSHRRNQKLAKYQL